MFVVLPLAAMEIVYFFCKSFLSQKKFFGHGVSVLLCYFCPRIARVAAALMTSDIHGYGIAPVICGWVFLAICVLMCIVIAVVSLSSQAEIDFYELKIEES